MEDKLRLRKWSKWGWSYNRWSPGSWALAFNEGGKILTITIWNHGIRLWIGIPYPWKPFAIAVGASLELQHPFGKRGRS